MVGTERWGAIGWAAAVGAALGLTVCARSARADKKKPGLFDFGGWKTPGKQQEDAARDLTPQGLDLMPAPGRAETRTVRLRVYADRDYRSSVLHWRAKARGQIDRANRVVEPVFGVRFEIESVRDWDRTHVGAPFGSVLTDLESLDPAPEVDWVLGLVTPFRGVSTVIHELGQARLLSRHFVLRGMDDEEEGRAIERYLHTLSREDKNRLYEVRKAHKEVVVFLHEWAHTMGALHHEEPSVVMNPSYDPRQTAFSDFEKRLIALALDQRLPGARPARAGAGDELRALVASAPTSEGSDRERAELLALIGPRATPAPGGGAPAAAPPRSASAAKADPAEARRIAGELEAARRRLALPPDAARWGVTEAQEPAYAALFWQAAEAASSGPIADARARLRELAAAFPDAPGTDLCACELELRAGHAAAAAKRCEAALAKFDEVARAHRLLGMIAARAHRDVPAEKHLRKALMLDPAEPEAWRALARFYRATGSSLRLDQLRGEYRGLFAKPLPE